MIIIKHHEPLHNQYKYIYIYMVTEVTIIMT